MTYGDEGAFGVASGLDRVVTGAELGIAFVDRSVPALGLVPKRGLPLRVLPRKCLPALSLFPGHTPAHEANWSSLGKTDMSAPISAKMTAAPCSLMPGMVCRSWYSFWKGARRRLSFLRFWWTQIRNLRTRFRESQSTRFHKSA